MESRTRQLENCQYIVITWFDITEVEFDIINCSSRACSLARARSVRKVDRTRVFAISWPIFDKKVFSPPRFLLWFCSSLTYGSLCEIVVYGELFIGIKRLEMFARQKIEAYNTGYSQAVTHPSTNPARQGLTSVIGREPVLSLWYGRRRGNGVEIVLVIGQVQAVKRPHPWV